MFNAYTASIRVYWECDMFGDIMFVKLCRSGGAAARGQVE